MEWWMLICFRQFLRVSCTCSSNYSVYDGECTYTHLLHAHFFCAQRAHSVLRTSSCVSHTRKAQVSWKRCLSHECHFSPSRLLPSHVSPTLAVSARSLRDHSRQRLHWRSRPRVLAELSRPESEGHAQLRTCIAKLGYLTKSDANTGYEPKKFGKKTSVDDDTTLINNPKHNISDFSKTTKENIRQFGVPTVFETSVSHDFFMMILLFRWKAKKACNRETVARQREREEREGFVISVALSMSTKDQRNGISEESQKILFWRVSANSILMDEISENIFDEELNKLL